MFHGFPFPLERRILYSFPFHGNLIFTLLRKISLFLPLLHGKRCCTKQPKRGLHGRSEKNFPLSLNPLVAQSSSKYLTFQKYLELFRIFKIVARFLGNVTLFPPFFSCSFKHDKFQACLLLAGWLMAGTKRTIFLPKGLTGWSAP